MDSKIGTRLKEAVRSNNGKVYSKQSYNIRLRTFFIMCLQTVRRMARDTTMDYTEKKPNPLC